MPFSVKRPNTLKQQAQKKKHKLVVDMSRLLRPFIVSSLKKASTDMPAYYKFIKMFLKIFYSGFFYMYSF